MNKYILTEKELKSLLKDRAKLEALECGGVDNWDYYGDAIADSSDYDEDECDFNVDKYLENYKKLGEKDV